MLTSFVATPVPAPALKPVDAYTSISREEGSVPPFLRQKEVFERMEAGTIRKVNDCNGGFDAGWLKLLERSFGTCVRIVHSDIEPAITGGGPVCRALDAICGQRSLCNRIHRTIHSAAAASGRVQRMRCPLGFLLVSVPVRVAGTRQGQIEFGPLGVGPVDHAEFDQRLRGLNLSLAQCSHLMVSLGAVRVVRTEDIDGIIALVERVAVVLANEALGAPAEVGAHEPAAVAAGRRFAELHLGGKITLADGARHVALSPDHFSRIFRRTTGMSFGEYVNRCRLANAQRLLIESPCRVAEISYACGFDSVPHFNRVFRRVTGTSPTRYRIQSKEQSLRREGTARG